MGSSLVGNPVSLFLVQSTYMPSGDMFLMSCMFEILCPSVGEPMSDMLEVEIIVLLSEMLLGLQTVFSPSTRFNLRN